MSLGGCESAVQDIVRGVLRRQRARHGRIEVGDGGDSIRELASERGAGLSCTHPRAVGYGSCAGFADGKLTRPALTITVDVFPPAATRYSPGANPSIPKNPLPSVYVVRG